MKRTGCTATRIYASCCIIGFPACALMWSDAHLLVTGHMRRWLDQPLFRFAKSSNGEAGGICRGVSSTILPSCFAAT